MSAPVGERLDIGRSPRGFAMRMPRHLLVAGSAWGSRIVTAGSQLLAIRLLLEALDLERYAIYALLVGLQGWYLLADFGTGISVQNHVSERRARNEPIEAVANAGRLIAIALLIGTVGVLWCVAPWIAPLLLRSFDFLPETEKTRLFFVAGALSIGSGIGSIVYKIWYAEQRGYLANLWPAVAALVGLAAIACVRWLPASDRLMASVAAVLAPPSALSLFVLLAQLWTSRARTHVIDGRLLAAIFRRAAGFWGFAVVAALTLQVDYIVLSQFFGAGDIVAYTLTTKIYGLTFFLYNAFLLALWPVLSELTARGEWGDVVRKVKRCVTFGLVYMAGCTITMVWAMPFAVGLLAAGQGVEVPLTLIIFLGVYQFVRVWCDTYSTLLQSMSWLRPFWILVPAQALLSCTLQWLLAPRYGLNGVVIGLTLSFVLTVAWGLPFAFVVRSRSHQKL